MTLVDAIASLNMSAEAFKTFWRLLYGGDSRRYTFAEMMPPNTGSDNDDDIGHKRNVKRVHWLRVMYECVIEPGMAYMNGISQLLQNREWLQMLQKCICNNIREITSKLFIDRLIDQATDNGELSFNEEWLFSGPDNSLYKRKSKATSRLVFNDIQDESTIGQWSELGGMLGKITVDLLNGRQNDSDSSWCNYSVAILSQLFDSIMNFVQNMYEGSDMMGRRLRVRESILSALYKATQHVASPEYILSICTESCDMLSPIKVIRSNNNLSIGPQHWYRGMANCMARYASLNIFKANIFALDQLEILVDNEKKLIRANWYRDDEHRSRSPTKMAAPKCLQLVTPKPNFIVTIDGDADGANTYAVHDFVLMQWAYFQRLASTNMTEVRERRITLPADFPPAVLRILLGVMYGVDLNNSIATNTETINNISDDSLRFILNECTMAYDLVVLPEDYNNAAIASSSSGDNRDVAQSLIQRLKREDVERSAVIWAERKDCDITTDRSAEEGGDYYDDDDENSMPVMPTTLASAEDYESMARYATKVAHRTGHLIMVDAPNLVKIKVENTPRLAAAFAILIDTLVVIAHQRDQFTMNFIQLRMVDRDAAPAGLSTSHIPPLPEIAVTLKDILLGPGDVANQSSQFIVANEVLASSSIATQTDEEELHPQFRWIGEEELRAQAEIDEARPVAQLRDLLVRPDDLMRHAPIRRPPRFASDDEEASTEDS